MGKPSPSLPIAHSGAVSADSSTLWCLGSFLGRLAELSGGSATATLTLALRLVLEAQKLGEPVSWVTHRTSSFFPPDAVSSGIDLDALVVIRLPTLLQAPRAADLLVRSGGFGLVVVDLKRCIQMPLATQTRLAGLTRKHNTALLFLTEKAGDLPSLGSLVSFRADVVRARKIGNRFGCEVRVLKDKRLGVAWQHLEVCRVPDGLR